MTDQQSHISLFNEARYQRCNLQPGQRLFRYDHCAGGRLVGTLSGVVHDNQLVCGHSAPFGGIDWARRREPVGAVVELIAAAARRARAEGLGTIVIRARPAYFGANEAAVEFALHKLGAAVQSCELSLGIAAGRYRTPADYVAALKSLARNRLSHGLRAGLVCGAAEGPAEWAACYEILADTKRRRGTWLKFSLDYLLGLRQIFGPRIAMHMLVRDGEIAAASLVYRIAPGWDCLAAWGDRVEHRGNEVMNVMAYHLVCEAIAGQVGVIDLGISSVDGVADDGLIQFKRSIGGMTGLRIDFRLSLERGDAGIGAA